MDTILLRTFLEVSKTRHFGRAAENLFITHSAVSFRIRQLEALIGAQLFNRQRNNLHLTQQGERLISYAESILATWQLALQDVGVSGDQSLVVGIGGTANIWDAFLQQQLPDIAVFFPTLSQRSAVDTQIMLVRSILEKTLDFGVVFDPPKIAEVMVEIITELELVLVSSQPGISFSQIEDVGYVFVDWGTAFNVQHARLFQKPLAPILHTSQSNIACEYLLRKGGAAFLPLNRVQKHLEDQSLHFVEDTPRMNREIYGIYLADTDKVETIKPIIDFLRENSL